MNLIEIADGLHSELGPSAADRWTECTASVTATHGIADIPSPYAISGTASHTLSEWCRKQNKRAEEFLGTTIRVNHSQGHTDVLVDQARVDSVQEFIDRMGEQPGDELIEERVYYTEFVSNGFGTLDGAKLLDYVARVTDFKDGEGVQKWAEMNPQLMLYALGLYLMFGWLYDFKKFVLAICQPRLKHYDEWEISVEDLLKWAKDVAQVKAAEALSGNGVFKAGPWCQFCRIRGNCRVRAEWVIQNAIGVFDDMSEVPAKMKEAAEKRLATLSNDELAIVITAMPDAIKFFSAAKAYAAKQIAEGNPVGDFKFVAGRSNRSFIVGDAEVLAKIDEIAASDELAVSKEDLYTKPKFKTVAQIEEIVGEKYFAPEKLDKDGFSVKKAAGPLHALVKKTPGAPTLVPGKDKREAVSVNPLDVFEEVEE